MVQGSSRNNGIRPKDKTIEALPQKRLVKGSQRKECSSNVSFERDQKHQSKSKKIANNHESEFLKNYKKIMDPNVVSHGQGRAQFDHNLL
jgi:phosphoribosylformylglycinamidine (FGAM) synthase-like amidotransferase family enzyme